jgi:uncharacterized membrane protein YeaQ/YmgE (transglycosylase-associated protein family)
MDVVGTLVGGLAAGVIIGPLARLVMPGRQNVSIIMTIVIGAVGAIAGGFVADWIGVGTTSGIDWIKHAIQVVIAALLVVGWTAMRKPKAGTGTTTA